MPAFSKLHIGALNELARQLRFAPTETLRRQLDRTRGLAEEIDPAIAYPEDWIVYRITGYRPELAAPVAFAGEALLADVSGLVERLSAAAKLSQSDLDPSRYLDLEALCARWRVSRKTVERWRRMGLVAMRVQGAAGRPKLLFPLESVERFERLQGPRIAEAGGYSRIDAGREERMLRRAAAYARLGCTLNQAAKRIAKRYGRALETVRQVLRRHEQSAPKPLFAQRGPPGVRERDLIARAHWLGIEPAQAAKRLSRSTATIHRVADDERAARLRVLSGVVSGIAATHQTGPARGAKKKPEGDPRLAHTAVVSGLGAPGERDLLDFIVAARAEGVALGVVEKARAAAYQALIWRAAAAIAGLPAHGAGALVLDRIETDLRWAARLKAELIRSHLPLLVRTLEGAIGRPLEEVRASVLGGLIAQAIGALGEAVDAFEPAKGGRLAAPAGLALTRLGTRFAREHEEETKVASGRARAAARVSPGVGMDDWTRRLAPWQHFGARIWLEPASRVRAGLSALAPRERLVLEHRFGWGPAPATLHEVAARMGITIMQAATLERAAMRRAMGRERT